MISEQPLHMYRHELDALFPLHRSTPWSPSSEDDCYNYSEPSLTPPSSPPSSPSMNQHQQQHHTLFRLLPTCSIPSGIQLGTWISITLEVVSEFGGYQFEADPSGTFRLQTGQTLLPLDCCLLLEREGQTSNQSPLSHGLRIEKRALQSTNWLGMDDLLDPGIGPSGRGGLEVCVMATQRQTPKTIWISVGSGSNQGIVPLVLGPIVLGSEVSTVEQTRQVLRPINIPQVHGMSPRIMLLKETWNNVPQGRVWDSAFVLVDMFSKAVVNGIRDSAPAMFAGKRILDLSAGTGLLGIFLAGLAQVEMESSSQSLLSSSSCTFSPLTPVSSQQRVASFSRASSPWVTSMSTTVILTDLCDALDLINQNIASNQRRIAPAVKVVAKELAWGASNLRHLGEERFDVVIASDVVYEESSFKSLLQTLHRLCAPGYTTLYLGYKRRALTRDTEALFFERVRTMFNVVQTLHEYDVHVWILKR
ncbi:putative methyltransferase-domain-containing protein [Dissophora ornata]|nr:putative methyltransferase-domain-containing protein [Dissophora ornata]